MGGLPVEPPLSINLQKGGAFAKLDCFTYSTQLLALCKATPGKRQSPTCPPDRRRRRIGPGSGSRRGPAPPREVSEVFRFRVVSVGVSFQNQARRPPLTEKHIACVRHFFRGEFCKNGGSPLVLLRCFFWLLFLLCFSFFFGGGG